MRRILVFFLATLCFSCGSSKKSSKNRLPSDWQAQPITVDGDSKDWPSPYPNSDGKAQVAYATSNDKENLYVTVETGDVMTELKILRAGMTVWIDTGGGKKQTMAINYPLPAEIRDMQMENNPVQQQAVQSMDHEKRMQERARNAVANAIQLSLEGFGTCSGGFTVKQTNNCGITVRMAVDEYSELVWEAAIPFKVLYGKEHLDKKDLGRPISICFEVKGMKWQGRNNGNKEGGEEQGGGMHGGGGGGGMRGGGMHGGGMHGGGGGMHGGGQREGQNGDHAGMAEATKTWKQFALAYQE